jgi:N-methylhydantoinase A
MRIAIDTGGTFTDCVFVRDGKLQIVKVASQRENPQAAIGEAVAAALRDLEDAWSAPEERGQTRNLDLVCGTTVGTNALLERRGGRVALITTAGFEDVLEIGRQARPKLYDFFVEKLEPLVPASARLGAKERLAWDGSILDALRARETRRLLRTVGRLRSEAVAVCFLFSFRNAVHEMRVAKALRRAGYLVSVSHEILPEFREYERTSTTVINAYLAPVMSRYLSGTQECVEQVSSSTQSRKRTRAFAQGSEQLPRSQKISSDAPRVQVMQSNGGIISAEKAASEPVTTILSGPAGGVIGAEYAAGMAGIDKAITFDMGGTSTDVALLSGQMQTTVESTVSGLPIAVPMLEIHTVGAGGGSIARFDRGGALRVGPQSAGADPGPICYGRGDQPTVTDAHAVLGHFSNAGLLGGAFALDVELARKRMDSLRGSFRDVEKFAEGILAVANAVMEKAIRVISVERGHDPRDYVLIAFGGAGGLHACALADALEMRGVLMPMFPGGLSALGILRADVVKEFSRTVLLTVNEATKTANELRKFFRALEQDAFRALRYEGFATQKIRIERRLDMRYTGQAYELTVPATGDFVAAFHTSHKQRFGYRDPERPVEIVNLRCRATGITEKPILSRIPRALRGVTRPPARAVLCVFDGEMQTAALLARGELRARHSFAGPAIVSEYSATTLVPRGWKARVDDYGQIFLAQDGRTKQNARRH